MLEGGKSKRWKGANRKGEVSALSGAHGIPFAARGLMFLPFLQWTTRSFNGRLASF